MKEFKTAEMDGRTKLLTIILLVLLPLLAISSFFIRPQKLSISLLLTVVFIAVIFISYAFVPKRIALSSEQILIQNLFGAVVINLNEIKSVEELKKTGLNLRTFGVGGLFGYFGYFNGRDVWYVTNIYKKVKITLKSGKIYMLSPENPETFVAEIQKISA
ncbi:hypothetical protein OA84_07725 [Kaistella solincola]|uniref:Bacterial Pleckstrin homology domain-containing protein n=1 Tax=Kaistella solincola TaxID=510955 RepID=A0ABR4ZPX3_9FLAO|nr:PH domain-containing protein [Kaistella solincola]KIA83401.1 hypothetical protein OA84_07725 [Kaistella solincola]